METVAITVNSSRLLFYTATGLLLGVASCDCSNAIRNVGDFASSANRAQVINDAAEGNMRITIGSETFTATLKDNPTVREFKTLLPLKLEMTELNGNEKYFHLSTRLPTNEISPGTIQNGDIMLYNDNSLVLFYETFKTSYSYTRLGHIDDSTGLAAALGAGAVTVKFESEK